MCLSPKNYLEAIYETAFEPLFELKKCAIRKKQKQLLLLFTSKQNLRLFLINWIFDYLQLVGKRTITWCISRIFLLTIPLNYYNDVILLPK